MIGRVVSFAFVLTLVLTADLLSTPAEVLAQEEHQFSNLRFLPEDISREELGAIMLENLRGLGLPRRQSQGCLFCHVGDAEEPSASWDYASDSKAQKRKAREMLAMVADINRRLAGLDDRVAPDLAVTCYTCHAGRTDPRPLPGLLMASYESGGVDELIENYRRLRERYYGADAYDLRPGVLSGLAIELADSGAFDDALVVANTNAEFFADIADIGEAGQIIRLERAYAKSDVEKALVEFDLMRSTAEASWGVLDLFGWRLSRRGESTDALEVFRHNLNVFPDQYIPNESMGDALWLILDDLEAAIGLFDKWLQVHPQHLMARRRVATLRAQR